MAKPKRKTRSNKFPLTLHKTGQFCKKIKGKIYYFGHGSIPGNIRLCHFKSVCIPLSSLKACRLSSRNIIIPQQFYFFFALIPKWGGKK